MGRGISDVLAVLGEGSGFHTMGSVGVSAFFSRERGATRAELWQVPILGRVGCSRVVLDGYPRTRGMERISIDIKA